MKHIKPLAISVESNELIIVRALCDNQEVVYRFMRNPDNSIRGIEQEDSFYFKTHDDQMAAFWLRKAVLDLIEANEEKVNLSMDHSKTIQPKSIEVSSELSDTTEYIVKSDPNPDNSTEYNFSVNGSDTNFSISNQTNDWTAEIQKRQWKLTPEDNAKHLLSAIISLHLARTMK